MSVQYHVFDSRIAAEQCVAALTEAGVPEADVEVFSGQASHGGSGGGAGGGSGGGAGGERTGRFAGSETGPEAEHVGQFDDEEGHDHTPDEERVGNFDDTENHHEDARDERTGSFADVDRDSEETFVDGEPQVAQRSHRMLLRRFVDAGMSDDQANTQLDLLHQGKAFVFVETTSIDENRVQKLLRG